jgi:uncharacterized protein YegL
MATEQESRFALLPAYLVLDTSASMGDDNAFESAFEFLPKLLTQMNKSAVVADKLRVEVITFDETAKVVFPLGTREELKNWLEEKKSKPIIPDGDWTKYGIAFDKLRAEIENGVQQIRSESYGGENYKTYRPVVFFITDGIPNDAKSSRDSAFASLTDEGFESRPNIVCVGVGKATLDQLKEYGAGRYQSPSNTYVAGNSKLVFISKDGVSPSAALDAIIPALVQSVTAPVGNAQATSGDPNEMPDIFGGGDDPILYEDIFDVFEQGRRKFETIPVTQPIK